MASGYAAATTIGTPNLTGVARAQAAESARVFEDYDDALTWFDEERHNLAAVQQAAAEVGLHQHVWQLAEAQKHFFVVRRHIDDFLAAQQLALTAARADGDRETEALMLSSLGGVYWMAGRLDESEDCCLQVRHLYRALGDVEGEATALIAHGVVLNHRGHPERCVDFTTQALDLLDGPHTLQLRAKALMNRAVVYKSDAYKSEPGPRPQGIADLREALTIFRQVGDRHSEAFAPGNLADFHLLDTDLDAALDLYREQQALARELADVYIEAEALRGSGDAHAAAHRAAQARQAWTEALALYEQIDHPKVTETRKRLGEQ
ncbi:tetratricopeptide repeat protein [Kitasatospora kifunensis]|uniref:Tetratricopeptide (TPR) repeat protein n=1 Tax=Kitasatospora kifunensis TaxID=58351 RepID=A0A7W7W0A3_KITKI|nr:tetratricopeptide repeat protein [Kitasatospora kifunensis]MBB4928559.1 tetratricopeptide (TPR) repeat protein [Kitasatospora kifunensis]